MRITHSLRRLSCSFACLAALAGCAHGQPRPSDVSSADEKALRRFAALEAVSGVRLGVCVLDCADGMAVEHRATERFPLCSTFKAVLAGAVVARAAREPGLLAREVRYGPSDVLPWSPDTAGRDRMTVADLCAAAVMHSDNTAANLLLDQIGEPAALTAFARLHGGGGFRLDRREPDLNTALPGDARDTASPRDMAALLRNLLLGDALPAEGRDRLEGWMRGANTGPRKIRAGIPAGWIVADKTGGGAYGTANDIALLRRPGHPPAVLVVFTTRDTKEAPPREEVIAQAARIAADWLMEKSHGKAATGQP